MSGLSARTSSCGGEGSLFGLGGEAFGGGAANLVAFFALRKMGASFLTSSSGASDRLLSLSESIVGGVVLWAVVVVDGDEMSRSRSWALKLEIKGGTSHF